MSFYLIISVNQKLNNDFTRKLETDPHVTTNQSNLDRLILLLES